MLGTPTIKKLDNAMEHDLDKELRDQGHYLTGRLANSIQPRIGENKNGVSLEVLAEDYIDQLNTGLPFNDPSFNGNNIAAHILEMISYGRLLGLSEQDAARFGVAVARKHRLQGMPTINSFNFASNGRRTHAIETSYSDNETKYEQIIEEGFSNELDDLIDKTFQQTIF